MAPPCSTFLLFVASLVSLLLLGIILSPIIHNLTLPPDYPDRVSDHPPSPHAPPRHDLTQQQIEAFRSDGVIVLRNILPPDLARKMDLAGQDLMENTTMHCEMTRFVGPPMFHAYDRYCGRAQLVHDYFRDVMYQSPLAHVAAQLLGVADDEPMRQLADVFMSGGKIPKRWHSDFPAFSLFGNWKDATPCQNGLVFWMPLEKSYEAKNGMLFINGSSSAFVDHFADDPSRAHQRFSFLQWVMSIPKDDYIAPTLDLGDVIVFDQCCVHTASGQHEGGIRRAYQLRFIKNFDLATSRKRKGIHPTLTPIGPGLGVASPQLWPQTLPDEDAIRSAGHVIYTRAEWMRRMLEGPAFSMVTTAIAWKTRLFGDNGGYFINLESKGEAP